MKPFLPLLLWAALSAPSFAQEAPNGYQTLIAAGKLILPGENGEPSAPDRNQAPAENLRRQRFAVARNAPALKLLRQALKLPIAAPVIKNFQDLDVAELGSFRELARQLRQESEVRLADGDVAGALDSRLTGLELGVAIAHDAPLISVLTGSAIEAVERQNFAVVAVKLEAPQLRAALARLQALDARRPTYEDVWRAEKAASTALMLSQFQGLFDPEKRKMLLTPAGRAQAGAEISEAQINEMLALTPASLSAQISAIFDALMARDGLPFSNHIPLQVPPGKFSLLTPYFEIWKTQRFRFSIERGLTENALFEAALELRAIKLESGAYPLHFAAPLDPFSEGKPLVYERDADKYSLYSVGPDEKDDGGTPIRTLVTNARTGAQEESPSLRENSTGDILGPVF